MLEANSVWSTRKNISKIFSLPGESHRFPERSVHSTSHGLFSHMSGKRAEAVGGQNETSDVESSGGYSGWLLTGLHSAPHKTLVLRGEHQVSQREDAV